MRNHYLYKYWGVRPAYAHCGNSSRSWHETRAHRGGGANFGVRRPLRYLRYHLDLDDAQTRRVAAVLNRLKLEREQAAVDEKRALHNVAAMLRQPDTTEEQLKTGLAGRIQTAERMQAETAKALAEVADALDPDQLERFSELIESGVVSI